MLSKNRKCHDLKIAYGVKGLNSIYIGNLEAGNFSPKQKLPVSASFNIPLKFQFCNGEMVLLSMHPSFLLQSKRNNLE